MDYLAAYIIIWTLIFLLIGPTVDKPDRNDFTIGATILTGILVAFIWAVRHLL